MWIGNLLEFSGLLRMTERLAPPTPRQSAMGRAKLQPGAGLERCLVRTQGGTGDSGTQLPAR